MGLNAELTLDLDLTTGVPAQTGHQLARRGFDPGRHFQNSVDPRKPLPSLDRADVHPVQPGQIAQLLLAEVGEAALAAEVAPESQGQRRIHQRDPDA